MPDRRSTLKWGLGLGLFGPMAGRPATASPELRGAIPLPGRDDTGWLQLAIERAAARGERLPLPAGRYRVSGLVLPAGLVLSGVPGATIIEGFGATLAVADRADVVVLSDLLFDLSAMRTPPTGFGALHLKDVRRLRLERVDLQGAPGDALVIDGCQGRIADLGIAVGRGRGLTLVDGRGLEIAGGRIAGVDGVAVTIERRRRGEDHTTLRGLTVDGVRGPAAIVVRGASGTRMTDVDVTDAHADGIAIEAAHAVSVTGARLRRIGGAAVSIEGESRRVRIADSSIEDSGVGIRDRGGGLSLITGNTIARTRIGIAIASAPLERVIEGNVIVDAVEGDVVMLDADGRPRASGASGTRTPG